MELIVCCLQLLSWFGILFLVLPWMCNRVFTVGLIMAVLLCVCVFMDFVSFQVINSNEPSILAGVWSGPPFQLPPPATQACLFGPPLCTSLFWDGPCLGGLPQSGSFTFPQVTATVKHRLFVPSAQSSLWIKGLIMSHSLHSLCELLLFTLAWKCCRQVPIRVKLPLSPVAHVPDDIWKNISACGRAQGCLGMEQGWGGWFRGGWGGATAPLSL